MDDEIMVDSISMRTFPGSDIEEFNPTEIIQDGRALDKLFVVTPKQHSVHYDQWVEEMNLRKEFLFGNANTNYKQDLSNE